MNNVILFLLKNAIPILKGVSVVFSAFSALMYYMAAKTKLPEPPHSGDRVEAALFEELFDRLRGINSLSAKGAFLLSISIIFQILVLILEHWYR